MRKKGEMQEQVQKGKGTINSSRQDGKQLGAMRIFEALSSVDEELLERSEGRKEMVPFWRYAKMLAACFCFVMLGVVAVTGSRFLAEDNSSCDCAAPESIKQFVMETLPEETQVEGAESGMEYVDDVMEEAEYGQDSVVTNGVGSGNNMEQEKQEDNIIEDAATKNLQQTQVDSCDIPLAMSQCSENELRAVEIFGNYIPTKLPAGYVFSTGYWDNADVGAEGISAFWENGMDTIRISVKEYVASGETDERMVDVSKSETYDVHQYEIPYADSVPEKYYMVFHYPIFRESDLTLDIIQSRMKTVADQGDTDTPRGNFAVLYDSGILVEFSGDGDAESIWEMFQSIEGR